MTASTPVANDDPLMVAWEAYKQTPEYANTRKWALHEQHVDGSLWAAFCAGRAALSLLAGLPKVPDEVPPETLCEVCRLPYRGHYTGTVCPIGLTKFEAAAMHPQP